MRARGYKFVLEQIDRYLKGSRCTTCGSMATETPTQHHKSCASLLAESSAQRLLLGKGFVLPMLIQPQLWLS